MNICPQCGTSMEGKEWYSEKHSNRGVCDLCSCRSHGIVPHTLTIAQLPAYGSQDYIEYTTHPHAHGRSCEENIGVDLIRIKQDIQDINERLATIEHEIKSEKKEVLPSETVS